MDWRDKADYDRWNKEFWDTPTEWPRDLLGMVFLARAVREVGWRQFGDKWDASLSPYSDKREDRELFKGAAETLATALAEGKVSYVLRGLSGGAYSKPLPPDQWIRDDLTAYFDSCRMDGRIAGQTLSDLWIFVPRQSLDSFLASLALDVTPSRLPTQDDINALMRAVLKNWQDHGKKNDWRVGREHFHTIADWKWPGVSTTATRKAFEDFQPTEWGKPGKFNSLPLEKIAEKVGISPQNKV
ncbi:MAG: hypothetical protein J0I98_15760 [Mesorhizobium sp.]|nr:hypothetical protein [Mesorhizobium sp.]MBN9244244.1 hypothetical protein [Mesorhizobium sp.]